MPSVRSGMLVYPCSEAKAVLERCADIAASAPAELTVQVGLVGGPVVFIISTWCDLPAQGEARTDPFLRLRTLLASALQTTLTGRCLVRRIWR